MLLRVTNTAKMDGVELLAQVKEDINRANSALEQLIFGNFEEAYRMLYIRQSRDSMYMSLGRGCLGFVRAMLSFEVAEVDAAINHLQEAATVAEKFQEELLREMYKNRSMYTRLYVHLFGDHGVSANDSDTRSNSSNGKEAGKATKAQQKHALAVMRAHCDLVLAESTMLKAVLAVFTDQGGGGWMLLIREAVHLRRSYLSYQFLHDRLFGSNEKHLQKDDDYKSGVLVGKGVFNLLFPLLPQALLPVFALFGYEGSLEDGLDQLHEAAEMCGHGLRSPIAALMLLIFYLVIAGNPVVMVMGQENLDVDKERPIPEKEEESSQMQEKRHSRKSWLQRAESLLEHMIHKYDGTKTTHRDEKHANSPIFEYFKGRLLYKRRKINDAIATYTNDNVCWTIFNQACSWEVIQCYAEELKWQEALPYAITLANESRWSKSFCSYIAAAVIIAANDARNAEVKEHLENVQKHFRRRLGKTIPLEKFALRRANNVLEKGELFFIPHYELLLIWDVLPICQARHQIYGDVSQELDQKSSKLTSEQKGIGHLILATIARSNGHVADAIRIIRTEILVPLEQDRHFDIEFTYIIPMAQCELARCLLELSTDKAIQEAKKIIKHLEGGSTRYLLEKAIRLRLSQMRL